MENTQKEYPTQDMEPPTRTQSTASTPMRQQTYGREAVDATHSFPSHSC